MDGICGAGSRGRGVLTPSTPFAYPRIVAIPNRSKPLRTPTVAHEAENSNAGVVENHLEHACTVSAPRPICPAFGSRRIDDDAQTDSCSGFYCRQLHQ